MSHQAWVSWFYLFLRQVMGSPGWPWTPDPLGPPRAGTAGVSTARHTQNLHLTKALQVLLMGDKYRNNLDFYFVGFCARGFLDTVSYYIGQTSLELVI